MSSHACSSSASPRVVAVTNAHVESAEANQAPELAKARSFYQVAQAAHQAYQNWGTIAYWKGNTPEAVTDSRSEVDHLSKEECLWYNARLKQLVAHPQFLEISAMLLRACELYLANPRVLEDRQISLVTTLESDIRSLSSLSSESPLMLLADLSTLSTSESIAEKVLAVSKHGMFHYTDASSGQNNRSVADKLRKFNKALSDESFTKRLAPQTLKGLQLIFIQLFANYQARLEQEQDVGLAICRNLAEMVEKLEDALKNQDVPLNPWQVQTLRSSSSQLTNVHGNEIRGKEAICPKILEDLEVVQELLSKKDSELKISKATFITALEGVELYKRDDKLFVYITGDDNFSFDPSQTRDEKFVKEGVLHKTVYDRALVKLDTLNTILASKEDLEYKSLVFTGFGINACVAELLASRFASKEMPTTVLAIGSAPYMDHNELDGFSQIESLKSYHFQYVYDKRTGSSGVPQKVCLAAEYAESSGQVITVHTSCSFISDRVKLGHVESIYIQGLLHAAKNYDRSIAFLNILSRDFQAHIQRPVPQASIPDSSSSAPEEFEGFLLMDKTKDK